MENNSETIEFSESQRPVKIISSDDVIFELKEEVAVQSGLIKSFLNEKFLFTEATERTFSLPIKSPLLIRIIEYMEYKHKHNGKSNAAPDFNLEENEATKLMEIATYMRL